MTPGNNGASTPEDDDPFGYLYADGQARGAQPPSGGYGYPNAVNRVRPVGERQYGQQAPPAGQPTAAYGQVPPQGAHGQPSPGYQAPETIPGGAPTTRQQPHGGGSGGRGRGPNTKGLLIGAIAVVAAVVIGIGVAMLGGDDDKTAGDTGGSGTAPTAEESKKPSASETESKTEPGELPEADAKTLLLEGGASTSSDVSGAKSDGGVYVTGFNTVGASVTWNINGIPKNGKYTVYVAYGVPGKDATATLTVNGTASTNPVDMKNWSNAPEGDYEKGWTKTYNYVQLNKGSNTIKISCEQGNQCDANIDQVWLVKGWVKR
jgi:hypothetical protein